MNLPILVLSVIMVLAAAWDVAQRRIPNPLVASGLLLGLAFGLQQAGGMGLLHALAGATVALLALLGPFALRMMGGGDVKIMMVAGAFLGWSAGLQAILAGTALHGVLALGWLVVARMQKARGAAAPDGRKLPHAVGFAIATIAVATGQLRFW